MLNDQQFTQLYRLYNVSPDRFDEEQVDLLEQSAKERGIKFRRDMGEAEFSLRRTIGQLGAGFVSGFTTIQVGDDPSNISEALARNVGSLAGFVGFVPGTGVAGRLAMSGFGRALGLNRIKTLANMADDPIRMGVKSVPMYVAEKVVGGLEKGLSADAAAKRFLQGRAGDVVTAGLHLGTASATGSWQHGIDEMMKSFALGAVEGSGFRALTNYFDASKVLGGEPLDPAMAKGASAAVRGVASSLWSGVPSTAMGEPIELQVYQYLLGAYFGVTELPFEQREAMRFIRDNVMKPSAGKAGDFRDRMLNVQRLDGFDKLDALTQDEVIGQMSLWWGRQLHDAEGSTAMSGEAFQAKVYGEVWKQVYENALAEGKTEEQAIDEAGRPFWERLNRVETQTRQEEANKKTKPPESVDVMRDQLAEEMVDSRELPATFRTPIEQFVQSYSRAVGRDGLDEAGVGRQVMEAMQKHLSDGDEGFDRAVEDLRPLLEGADAWKGDLALTLDDGTTTFNPRAEPLRMLRQAWKRLSMTQQVNHVYYESTGSESFVKVVESIDDMGKRVERATAPTHLDLALGDAGIDVLTLQKYQGRAGGRTEIKDIFDLETFDYAQMLLDLDRQGQGFIAAVKDKGQIKLSNGFVFERKGTFVPSADGTLRRAPVSPQDASRVVADKLHRAEALISSWAESGSERARDMGSAMQSYEQLVDDFRGDFTGKGLTDLEVRELHDRMWLNTIATVENMNNMSFEDMLHANLSGEGKFILSAQDLNKRMQVFTDGSVTAAERFYQHVPGVSEASGFRFALVNSTRGGKEMAEGVPPILMDRLSRDGKSIEQYQAEHHLDGVMFLHRDAFEAQLLDMGLDPAAGTTKGVVMYQGEQDGAGRELGAMMGKLAFFRADDDLSASMDAYGLHGLMYDTASKQPGMRKLHDLRVREDGQMEFMEQGGDAPIAPETYVIPFDGMRVNMGVSENTEHATHDIKVPRQFSTNFTDPDAVRRFMETYTIPQAMGDESVNKRVYQYLLKPDAKLLDEIDVDRMGLQEVMEVLTRPGSSVIEDSDLYRKVVASIARKAKEDPDFGRHEDFMDSDALDSVFDDNRAFDGAGQRLLDLAVQNRLLTPAVVHSKLLAPYMETMVRNYLVDRVLRPTVGNSGSAILQPQDPHFQLQMKRRFKESGGTEGFEDGVLPQGQMVLGDSWRQKRVRWVGGEEVPLEKAWEDYQALRKKGKLTGAEETRLQEMEDLLHFAVIRVPADSKSGTRMLKFAGFHRKGAGLTLHNEDMVNIGGADLDIDKAFLMQDPDRVSGPTIKGQERGAAGKTNRPMRRHIEENAEEWYLEEFQGQSLRDKDGRLIHRVIRDSKEHEDLFARTLEPHERHAVAMGSPRLLFQAGRGAFRGNASLGTAAVGSRRANVIAEKMGGRGEWVTAPGKHFARLVADGVLPDSVTMRGGRYEVIGLGANASIESDLSDFNAIRRELMNFSADAGNYAGLTFDRESAAYIMGSRVVKPNRWRVKLASADDPNDAGTWVDVRDLPNGKEVVQRLDERGASMGWTNLGRSLSRLDSLANGRRYNEDGTASKYSLWETLEGLRAARGVGATSTWYESLALLGDLNYRVVGDAPDGTPIRREDLAPYMGKAWEREIRPAFNRIAEDARSGDPLAREVMEMVFREDLRLPEKRRVRQGTHVVDSHRGPERKAVEYTAAYQLQNDLSDVASVVYLHEKGKRARAAGASIETLRGIAQEADAVREMSSTFFKMSRGHGLSGESRKERREANMQELAERVATFKAGLRSDAERDYFDAYLISSLSPQEEPLSKVQARVRANHFRRRKAIQEHNQEIRDGKKKGKLTKELTEADLDRALDESRDNWWRTNQTTFGFSLRETSDQAIIDYLKTYNKIAQATRKDSLTKEEARRVVLLGDVSKEPLLESDPVLKANGGTEQRIFKDAAFGEDFFRRQPELSKLADQLFDPAVVGRAEAERNRMLYDDFKSLLLRYPQLREEYVSVFEGVTSTGIEGVGVTPQRATWRDLKYFLEFFGDVSKRKYLDEVFRAEGRIAGLPFKPKAAWMVFPETIGEWHLPHDLHVGKTQVRKILTLDGIVDKEVRVPFSTFSKMTDVFKFSSEEASSAAHVIRQELASEFSFLDAAAGADADTMFELAVALREMRVAGDDNRTDAAGRTAREIYEFEVKRRWKDYERLADKVFFISEDGSSVPRRVTGRQIMGHPDRPGMIDKKLTRIFSEAYDTWISRPDEESRWLVTEKVVGSDETTEYDRVDPYKSLSKIGDYFNREGRFPNIGLEALYKIAHQIRLREKVSVELFGVQAPLSDHLHSKRITRQLYEATLARLEKENPYRSIGRIEESHYFPHLNHDTKELDRYFSSLVEHLEKQGVGENVALEQRIMLKRAAAMGHLDDMGSSEWIQDTILGEPAPDHMGLASRPGNVMSRGETIIPGWDHSRRAVERYHTSLSKAYYNTMMGLMGNRLLNNFKATNAMGEHTGAWANFGELYMRDALGYPSVFPERLLNDPELGLRKSPYWYTSGHMLEEKVRKFAPKYFRGSVIGDPKSMLFQRKLSWLSNLEAKWELMTLLSTTRAMVNNVVGGGAMTAISSGWRPFLKAGNIKYLNEINPSWNTWADVDRFVERHGGIESYIVNEANLSGRFKSAKAQRFLQDVIGELRRNPNLKDADLGMIARRHGMGEGFVNTAAWFMRASERVIRRRAFLAHYIKAREALEVNHHVMEPDHPWLISMAQKGVWGTQFLYNNAARPAIARTALGKVFTRFQTWTMNSMRFRKELHQEARAYGWTPGSEAYNRYERMVQADMFMFALASLLPASMFEATLPAPMNYLKDFVEYFFGDEEERDNAFFGVIPYPFNPVQVVLPPISRYFTSTFSALLSNDWDRFASYHAWSFFPFGLLGRSAYMTAQNPVMGVQAFTGIPLHRISREMDNLIDSEMRVSRGLVTMAEEEEEPVQD